MGESLHRPEKGFQLEETLPLEEGSLGQRKLHTWLSGMVGYKPGFLSSEEGAMPTRTE